MNWKVASIFIIPIGFLALASCAAQPSASAQIAPTVTPLPGPVATLNAANDRIDQAQQAVQDANAAAAEAAQRARDARDTLNAAQAAYNAAQAAIQAQQVAVANGLIGDGNSKVQSALSQIDALMSAVNEHQRLFDAWSAQRISDTITIRDLTRDKATLMASYNATAAQLQTLQNAPKPQTIDTSWLLVAFGFLAILLIVAVYVISRRGAQPVPIPPRSDFYDDVIDGGTPAQEYQRETK